MGIILKVKTQKEKIIIIEKKRKNVRQCHVKSLARMESACVLRESLMSFMYNISYTKQSNLLLHFFRTLKRWSVFVLLLPCCVSQLLNDGVHLRVDVPYIICIAQINHIEINTQRIEYQEKVRET